MATERNTRIRASQITSVRPEDMEATNSPSNNQVPSYNVTLDKFTWSSSAGGGTSLQVFLEFKLSTVSFTP